MFTVEYLQDEGEIQFTYKPLRYLSRRNLRFDFDSNIDTDVTQIEGGLSISIPLFIEFFDNIIDVIRNVDDEVFLTNNARQIIRFTQIFLLLTHYARLLQLRRFKAGLTEKDGTLKELDGLFQGSK